MQSAGFGRLAAQDVFSNYGSNLRKNLTFDPNPIVGVESPVSRVEMNAKNAPLTPASPHRRLLTQFLRPRAVKTALTKPTQSYTANRCPFLFRCSKFSYLGEDLDEAL